MGNTLPSKFSDRELLFGAAIAQVVMRDQPVMIWEKPESENNLFEFKTKKCYSLILFKYSTKPKQPWQFSFTREQINLLVDTKSRASNEERFFALVCHLDGVCLVSQSELLKVSTNHDDNFSISITRPPKAQYRVSGPGKNTLDSTIPQARWTLQIVGDLK